jgi:1-deoxy-D-xylulose-5-phosphate reductoisomerase
MRNIVILGSTGSIGAQALDICARLPEKLRVVGLAAHRNADRLAAQANEFGVSHVCIGSAADAEALKRTLPDSARVYAGEEGLCALATLPEADVVVVAVAGAIGIGPTHAAIDAGKTIALASKEVLVAAGEHTMRLARERGIPILPIDSEHSAIFQCLQGAPERSVEKIVLTASGGPFRERPAETLAEATPDEALRHPNWSMGPLVTINSATLMNKALEMIEAHWLFDVPMERVEVVIHPTSIVHSLVQFTDSSILAQLGRPDMRLPIQYALVYPERPDTQLPRLDLLSVGALEFSEPDPVKFPALQVAREAVAAGGTMPAVMNAANETAVDRFLRNEIRYTEIVDTVRAVMARHKPTQATLEAVLEADAWAREAARGDAARAGAVGA